MKEKMNRRRAWENALSDPARAVSFLENIARDEIEWIKTGYSDGCYARSLLEEAMKTANAETCAALLECGRQLSQPGFDLGEKDHPVYWEIGEHVLLGSWPQRTNGEVLPVEWIVAGAQNDTRFLISAYALDCLSYNKRCTEVTWEKCDLRAWLNRIFFETAFDEYEKERLIGTRLCNADNPLFQTAGGAPTVDRVFLPGIEDILNEAVFEDEVHRACIATPYAKIRGAFTDGSGHGRLWLRCPGDHADYAACLNCNGSISYSGNGVNCDDHAVRPMICVRIGSPEYFSI